MSLSAYFVVADARTASLQIILDKVVLTSCTTAVSFEMGFEDASLLKKDTFMMWMVDADGNAMFCALFYQHNT